MIFNQQFCYQPATNNSSAESINYDTTLSFLKQYSAQELQNLLDDNTKLESVVDQLDILKQNRQDKETLMATNKSIAEMNMSYESKLINAKQKLADTYQRAAGIQRDFERNKLQFDSSPNSASLDVLLALLQTEIAKGEESSENLAQSLLASKLDLESFVSNFLSLRSLVHVRRTKVEKLTDLMKPKHSTPARSAPIPPINTPATNNASYPSQYYPPPPLATQYPYQPLPFPQMS